MSHVMLIDAGQTEETRVVMVEDDLVQEYDIVTSTKPQIKGNVYLAKVTRVEPSLQAAFVEYGGDRQSFLPFAEIHPDYYQIPAEDRAALLEEDTGDHNDDESANAEGADDAESSDDDEIETITEDDDIEESRSKRSFHKRYKIQEVIKKGQVLLIQIIKEERGNKGAAATTYLSLAGRYCVLMPNSPKAGGISRKIADAKDRKRLRGIIDEMKEKTSLNAIIRTAGSGRSRAEIKRDFDYLSRLWNDIREKTLSSTAPAMVYEEGNIIKRSIRDLYHSDVEHVLVDGDEAYKEAKAFMKMLMPSHAPRVKQYKETIPLFHAYEVEDQLLAMNQIEVPLKSGGYLVINPTEALVSVDVNSGKSTRERNVEKTALHTNIEAAFELARQMRLRDLAGLIVIDFIDMYEYRNRRTIEQALKEALKQDRARIQVGRISAFGLLEMSRQRMRPSLVESSSTTCPSCDGMGVVRSMESVSTQLIRHLGREASDKRYKAITIWAEKETAFYMLNEKRDDLIAIENDYNIAITIIGDERYVTPRYRMERLDKDNGNSSFIDDRDNQLDKDGNVRQRRRKKAARASSVDAEMEKWIEEQLDDRSGSSNRRRRGGRKSNNKEQQQNRHQDKNSSNNVTANDAKDTSTPDGEKKDGKKTRRGGRRLWRRRRDGDAPQSDAENNSQDAQTSNAEQAAPVTKAPEKPNTDSAKADTPQEAKKPSRRPTKKAATSEDKPTTKADKPAKKPAAKKASATTKETTAKKPAAKTPAKSSKKPASADAANDTPKTKPKPAAKKAPPPPPLEQQASSNTPKRSGWWNN